jgi:hypothetical protein
LFNVIVDFNREALCIEVNLSLPPVPVVIRGAEAIQLLVIDAMRQRVVERWYQLGLVQRDLAFCLTAFSYASCGGAGYVERL